MTARVQTVQVEDTFNGVTYTLQLQGVKKIDDNATNVGCTGVPRASLCSCSLAALLLLIQLSTCVGNAR
jgi:hypothetical protein